MFPAFEHRILRAACKEVLEGGLAGGEDTVARDAGNLIQPRKLTRALDSGEFRIGVQIPVPSPASDKRHSPPVQNMVINEARTAKRLGQQLSLSHCKDSQLIGGSENRGHWHGSAIPPH